MFFHQAKLLLGLDTLIDNPLNLEIPSKLRLNISPSLLWSLASY